MIHPIAPRSDEHRLFLERQDQRFQELKKYFCSELTDCRNLTLELGCGHGHYLAAYAAAHPKTTCLGIDLVSRRIELALKKRDKRKLTNLHFLKAEATECLSVWPTSVLIERVFVLFPDPWPKKRHLKNRLLQHQLLDALGKHAVPNLPLHFRTDDAPNFAWATEQIETHPDWELSQDENWPLESPSYFQELLGGHRSFTAVKKSPCSI